MQQSPSLFPIPPSLILPLPLALSLLLFKDLPQQAQEDVHTRPGILDKRMTCREAETLCKFLRIYR